MLAELDAADARAVAVAAGLSKAQLNWRPSPRAWSIGQCLEHLAISNEVYMEPIKRSLLNRPAEPVNEIAIPWFGRWFIRVYIDPRTQKRKAKAPRKSAPVAPELEASILDRFLASDIKVREVISLASVHDVNRVRFVNPFVGWIRFTVGTGFEIIARHNHRHLGQAERVKQSPGFPQR